MSQSWPLDLGFETLVTEIGCVEFAQKTQSEFQKQKKTLTGFEPGSLAKKAQGLTN
jgi:hypothetical protein